MSPAPDHRAAPRRRGAALEAAILEAALAELAEVGYGELRMERVAQRAQASKASLYRRWPGKTPLLMDAVQHAFPDLDSPPDTGTLRTDLLTLMRRIATQLAGPAGHALSAVLADSLLDPTRAARVRSHPGGSTMRAMRVLVDRAVARGEVDALRVTDRRVEAGPALLRHHFITHGAPIPDHVVVEIVDEVVLPLLSVADG
ncbi:TetR/AcrR family transcriptional regulator [Serinicoccus kebangsaanensis]|uniref:TetR/AcrR family transcriptional regulator n=1 Tax=Serinicoccus kebangsaanensis TaxID=2602069 RepID=UPI00124C29D9|nr:TetR/AcrR family transcriptional regulator [Serinicoccus kebangsaanensis]